MPIEKLEAEMHRGDSYVKLFEKMPLIILGKWIKIIFHLLCVESGMLILIVIHC